MSDFPNRSFFAQKKEKKSDWSFSKWTNAQPSEQGWAIAHLLIAHFRSFQKSDWAIARSFALLKRATEQLLFLLLFAKEQMSDRSFQRSLQKSKWAIALFLLFSKERPKSDHSFALSKRATKRAIALLLKKSKRAKMSNRSFSKWGNAQPWPQGSS